MVNYSRNREHACSLIVVIMSSSWSCHRHDHFTLIIILSSWSSFHDHFIFMIIWSWQSSALHDNLIFMVISISWSSHLHHFIFTISSLRSSHSDYLSVMIISLHDHLILTIISSSRLSHSHNHLIPINSSSSSFLSLPDLIFVIDSSLWSSEPHGRLIFMTITFSWSSYL